MRHVERYVYHLLAGGYGHRKNSFRRSHLKGYLNFGAYQMGEKSVNFLAERLDQILIGLILGQQVLGYYSLAINLISLPVSRINPIITRVAFPVFSILQNQDAQLRMSYMTVSRVLSAVNFPDLCRNSSCG